jgi:hypothetical protein
MCFARQRLVATAHATAGRRGLSLGNGHGTAPLRSGDALRPDQGRRGRSHIVHNIGRASSRGAAGSQGTGRSAMWSSRPRRISVRVRSSRTGRLGPTSRTRQCREYSATISSRTGIQRLPRSVGHFILREYFNGEDTRLVEVDSGRPALRGRALAHIPTCDVWTSVPGYLERRYVGSVLVKLLLSRPGLRCHPHTSWWRTGPVCAEETPKAQCWGQSQLGRQAGIRRRTAPLREQDARHWPPLPIA